jgi:hypothetical protein
MGSPRTTTAALAALARPTAAERAADARSPFPRGAGATAIRRSGFVATVGLTGSALVPLRTIPRLRLIGAITYTLTSFPGITTVRFSFHGKPWGVWDHSGRVIRDYRRGNPTWLTACAPGDGCFSP